MSDADDAGWWVFRCRMPSSGLPRFTILPPCVAGGGGGGRNSRLIALVPCSPIPRVLVMAAHLTEREKDCERRRLDRLSCLVAFLEQQFVCFLLGVSSPVVPALSLLAAILAVASLDHPAPPTLCPLARASTAEIWWYEDPSCLLWLIWGLSRPTAERSR